MNNEQNIVINKRKSATEESVDILKDLILNGDLKTGDFLPPEKKLCDQLGVGRSTLREAVKILESRGMVRKKHGYGVMVVDESQEAVKDTLRLMLKRKGTTMDELMQVRYINELKTVELAAKNSSEEDIKKIEKYLLIMRNQMASTSDYVQADMSFHLEIARASKNRVFYLLLQTVRPLIEEMIVETLKKEHRPEHSMKFHEKIFEAIKSKNCESAVNAMKEHLDATKSMLNE